MDFEQLLESIRAHYLKHFRGVLREKRLVPSAHVITEPALSDKDGEVVREGALKLPKRLDMVVRADFVDDASLEITTDSLREFEPIALNWNDAMEVSLHPFRWESCPIMLHGAPTGEEQWWPVVEWYEKWFDEFDSKASLKRDVQEVVHFMSDPAIKEGVAAMKIDFGTAPASAFTELLDVLQNIGVQAVEIGE